MISKKEKIKLYEQAREDINWLLQKFQSEKVGNVIAQQTAEKEFKETLEKLGLIKRPYWRHPC